MDPLVRRSEPLQAFVPDCDVARVHPKTLKAIFGQRVVEGTLALLKQGRSEVVCTLQPDDTIAQNGVWLPSALNTSCPMSGRNDEIDILPINEQEA